jgi:hypothetical protein
MAEIKSTLDLVLERTKNLAMTAEEKEKFQRREREENLRGWTRKFLNGLSDLKSLKKEMERVGKELQEEVRNILKELVIEQIKPEGDNRKAFQILEKLLGINKDPYVAALRAFQARTASEQPEFLKRARLRLAEQGISGSAVFPDISRDEEWNLFYQQTLTDFRRQISCFPDN